MATYSRKYVVVNVSFNEDGVLMSRQIVWEDGRVFDVDRVLDIRTASSLKAGSGGDRFKIWSEVRKPISFSSEAAT